MKKTVMLILLLSVFSALAEQNNYQLQVNGLACPFCEYNIQKKLSKLDGVMSVEVILKDSQVNVRMQEGKKLPEAQIKQEITDAGFTLMAVRKSDEEK